MSDAGVWRFTLPPQATALTPTSLHFFADDGSNATLHDVLFGDVFLCGGQSNMMIGLHAWSPDKYVTNASAEIASAGAYAERIRLYSAGMDDSCMNLEHGLVVHGNETRCAQPARQLNERAPPANTSRASLRPASRHASSSNRCCFSGLY